MVAPPVVKLRRAGGGVVCHGGGFSSVPPFFKGIGESGNR